MAKYKDLSGDSGVASYKEIEEGIEVTFRSGETYVYTYAATGYDDVTEMLRLARAGRGLSTYISKYVRERYAFKY